MSESFWRRCNMCKNPIGYEQKIFECSVSTCRQKRTGMVFCSLPCWEAHLPMMRHRDAWAEDGKAPSQAEAEASTEAAAEKTVTDAAHKEAVSRRVVPAPAAMGDDELPKEILIVASKLKKYIRARSGMNTSEDVLSVLSDHIRKVCHRAISHAAEDGRKTVKGRDFSNSV